MREFEADPETTVHPQTVIEHFGSWNAAKRQAGLVPRRFATREELLDQLRALGEEIGRVPTAKDIEARRGRMPSKSLYWHTFGSLTNALREAGFDVAVGEERLDRALDQGVLLAIQLGRLPKFADWAEARRSDINMLTEWQVYRMFDARRGAWSTFQFLLRERLVAAGRRGQAGDGDAGLALEAAIALRLDGRDARRRPDERDVRGAASTRRRRPRRGRAGRRAGCTADVERRCRAQHDLSPCRRPGPARCTSAVPSSRQAGRRGRCASGCARLEPAAHAQRRLDARPCRSRRASPITSTAHF